MAMKFLVRAVLSAAFVLGAAAPASACCLWPFGGWWGAGYSPGYGYGAAYPAPAYSAGYYSAGYYPSAGYYSAGYASSSACCATSCCDPCGGSSCGSSSCVGTTPSESLKATPDSNFKRKSYEEEQEEQRQKLRDPDRDTNPPARRDNMPDDGFDAGRGMGGSFEPDPVDGVRKPPMGDIEPDAGAKEPDGFLPKEEPQARRTNGTTVVAHTAGMLNGTGGARRLASRSLPATSPKSTAFAGKSNDDKTSQPAPVRWISVPAPEGQVRL